MRTSNGFLLAENETFSVEFRQLEGNEKIPVAIREGTAPGVTAESPSTLVFQDSSLLETGGDPRDTRFWIHPQQPDLAFGISAFYVQRIYNDRREIRWENSGVSGINVQ